MSTREELRESLPLDHEYRHAYADEILNLMVCTQIRVLREQQDMTQGQLARAIGTTQTAISRIENVDYSNWNIRTLKKIAKAFDLRLRITFENFGILWKDVSSLNRHTLERARNIEEDPEFSESKAEETTRVSDASIVSVSAEESTNNVAGVMPSKVLIFRPRPKTVQVSGVNYRNAQRLRAGR